MRDLTEQLTVFLVSSGNNPNYSVCLQDLQKQSCKFNLDIIRDYSPMSHAFQEMLRRVKTPYYIECDEDMVLNHNAVEKMFNEIEGSASNPKTAMHCYMLQDVHLNMPIYGIKIYKTAIFKNYPYNLLHPSCEMDQLQRMERDGYTYKFFTDVVGQHSPHWSPELIFERYYNLMEKFKIYRYVWMEKLPEKLWSKIKSESSDINMYAFAGCLASIFSDTIIDKEKDFRRLNKNIGRIFGYFRKPHQCTLYLSSNCNFKCDFCYRQHHSIEQSPEMKPEMVDLIMGKFPSINGYCICGFCEPLMSPNLIPILQKLKAGKKVVGIITNGSLLTRNLPHLIGWYQPNYISVSLNAHCKEEHEKITGTQSWDSVIEGIKALVASPIETYVSSVVTTKNLYQLPYLVKLVHSLGVKTLHLHNILPHADINKNTNFWDLVLTKEYHQSAIDELKKMPESCIIKKYPVLIDGEGGKGACQFPFYSLAVNGNGSISYCNSVLPCDARYGNINDFVVWNSPQAQKFRDDFCNRKLPHCSMCFRDWVFDGRQE